MLIGTFTGFSGLLGVRFGRMLKNVCERCHSDPERSEGEESRSGNEGLARFLVVPQGGIPRNDRLDESSSILLDRN